MTKTTWLLLSAALLLGLCVVCSASAAMVWMSRPTAVSYFAGEDEVNVTLTCPAPLAERDYAAFEARLRQLRVIHELEVVSPTELRLHAVGIDPGFTRYLVRPGHIEFAAVLDAPGAVGRTRQSCEQGICSDIVVAMDSPISNEHIANVEVAIETGTNAPIVNLTLTAEGTTRFATLTSQLVHQRLAIMLDDRVIMAPRVQAQISGGQVVINLGESASEADRRAEAEAVALALRGGVPLQCAWEIVREEHVAH